jgi:hypothetical protein
MFQSVEIRAFTTAVLSSNLQIGTSRITALIVAFLARVSERRDI